ncbi:MULTISPECIES: hypothetical protein [Rhizobium]|uniref:Uncharacterized protein n=1 Tax=Rhizobium esperanzae TaxID=1967781 RepID=A0A7W6XYU2_9HYPH|nr:MULTISPECIES: hypothetical protein [Rhizobium]MBB4442912.1 hypothetical protein [Rhizobium esperanzae]MDH6205683.1 hypothetical protein [Rhizobium leguminosarum]
MLSAIIVGGAILIRPSDFDRCLAVISAEIYRRDQTATLDPREVEAQAARICSGNEPK